MKRTSNDTPRTLDRVDQHNFIVLVEARDFLRIHLPKLSPTLRRAVVTWACGSTRRQIAAAERVSEQEAGRRVQRALDRLRELGEGDADRATAKV